MAQNKLQEVLNNEGWTQKQLSDASGVGTTTINKVCLKKRSVTIVTQVRIIKGLNKLAEEDRYKRRDVFS